MRISLLLLFILPKLAFGQFIPYDYGSNRNIEISLVNRIIYGRESGFDINISITNKTDTTFLLYGLSDDGWRSKQSVPHN
ncbi:MAG: hypothetical protein QM734_15370 [Cyclobacteriaceae bacterium]